ncbi:hypothetical protein LCGC14_0276170 [marine sediment metagenome]|uniref:Uncharacterized protein n=1 Tax=marine sediment metagenome TaxID=412755 RepID=A0A0F9TXS7_9ZZZZ
MILSRKRQAEVTLGYDMPDIQIFWKRSRGGLEFGAPITCVTSHVLVDGEVVEFPRAVAQLFPGGSAQVCISQSKEISWILAGPNRRFVQMTATLWLFYLASLNDAAMDSLTLDLEDKGEDDTEEVMTTLDSIQAFLKSEDKKKGTTDEAE